MSTENSTPATNSLLEAMDAIETSGHTEIVPVASPLKASYFKEKAVLAIVVIAFLFLAIVGIQASQAFANSQGATQVSTSCVDNVKFEGKVPAEYGDMHPDRAVKVFQKDNPRLASKWLHETSLGCGLVGR